MAKTKTIWLGLMLTLGLTACKDTTLRSAVPNAPVQLSLNIATGSYVHFVPTNLNEYIIIDHKGWHYHNQTLPLRAEDYYGYAGIILYIDTEGYTAYDACCPKCLNQRQPVEVDVPFADCPVCGERYDLSFGLGTPTLHISREALRRYRVTVSGDQITIRN